MNVPGSAPNTEGCRAAAPLFFRCIQLRKNQDRLQPQSPCLSVEDSRHGGPWPCCIPKFCMLPLWVQGTLSCSYKAPFPKQDPGLTGPRCGVSKDQWLPHCQGHTQGHGPEHLTKKWHLHGQELKATSCLWEAD